VDRGDIQPGGHSVTTTVLPLAAVSVLHASAFLVSPLTAAAWLPRVLIGLPAGAWIDSVRHRRRLMISCDLVSAALFATVPLARLLGHLTGIQLLLVALGAGCSSVVFSTTYKAFVIDVVGDAADRAAANSALQGSASAAQIGGRGLGGRIGSGRALLVTKVSGCAAALLIPLATSASRLGFLITGGFLVGVGIVAGNIISTTFVQSYTPAAIYARVSATTNFINYGTMPARCRARRRAGRCVRPARRPVGDHRHDGNERPYPAGEPAAVAARAARRSPGGPAPGAVAGQLSSRASTSARISSGVTVGSYRAMTLPSRSTRNFVKFHLISSVPVASVRVLRTCS
jgi:hypothetical protein